MTAFRRTSLLAPGQPFEISVDGRPVVAYAGETVAAALLAAGVLALRTAPSAGAPRTVFCGMGACFNCLVTVDGVPNVRSCAVLAQPGQRVELGANGHS